MGTMDNQVSILNNEKGSVIVLVLIMLALLTILGISSTNTSTTEVMISNNTQRHQLVFYAAESGRKEGAMWLQNFADTAPPDINSTGTNVKNFGNNGCTPNVLNLDFPPNSEDQIFGIYGIPYWYQITHLPSQTGVVAGSGKNYRTHFYEITSVADRRQTVEVMVSKIFKEGYK